MLFNNSREEGKYFNLGVIDRDRRYSEDNIPFEFPMEKCSLIRSFVVSSYHCNDPLVQYENADSMFSEPGSELYRRMHKGS